MAGQTADIAAADNVLGELIDIDRRVRRARAAPLDSRPFAPEDVAGFGIDICARGRRLREMAHCLLGQIDHRKGAVQRRRKGAVEPEVATIGAHRVVNKIEALLHRRNPVRQHIARHPRRGMGDGGEQRAVVKVDHILSFYQHSPQHIWQTRHESTRPERIGRAP